ncbi:hypothetical protein WA026_009531 [Henosepilachna vigintioctopunctata]|uniref:Protein arginine N-methyltransferase domain-containing protein n=1 Tax=Henosepilachna vigintioctopunctata TaxID=420089 RepID=A0AAW1TYK0_9CUCU
MAMVWFQDNYKLYNIFGSFIVKMGDLTVGLQYILLAYKIAVERKEPRLAIENNMLHVIWNAMPRWHFRMLNGKLRNDSYRKAIHKALDRGLKNVVDIGSGCGLLSLYTGIHPSRPSIMAFEVNPILSYKGVTLMKKYCEHISYTSCNILSHSVKETVEPEKDLLITEIFDVGFFGEGILKTLYHAFDILLDVDYTIIPASVTMYITGIECEALDKKFRLYNKLDLHYEEKLCLKRYVAEDRYDSEAFALEKYEILTETVSFLDMSLNCEDEVERLLENEWINHFDLRVIKPGSIHCFVVWFDLNLDEEIVISTNPFHTNYEPCWEQAIFYCQHPIKVEANEIIPLRVALRDEKLYYQLERPPMCIHDHCYEVSKSALQFLNDKEWTDFILQLCDDITDGAQNLCFVDFCEFPLAGLKAAEYGHTVFCFYKEPLNVAFILYMIRNANIKESLVTLLHYDYYPHAILNMKHLDYVVYEPISQDGSLKACPMDNGLFKHHSWQYFFTSIIVHFAFIDSPYLDYCNKVNPENVAPFNGIVEEMNEYSGSEHPDLENNFPHEIMSNEVEWKLTEEPFSIEILYGLRDGKINGILTWFTFVGKTGKNFAQKQVQTLLRMYLHSLKEK